LQRAVALGLDVHHEFVGDVVLEDVADVADRLLADPLRRGGIENYTEMNNYVWNDNAGSTMLPGVVEVVPEPAAAGASAVLALLALRWRRSDGGGPSV